MLRNSTLVILEYSWNSKPASFKEPTLIKVRITRNSFLRKKRNWGDLETHCQSEASDISAEVENGGLSIRLTAPTLYPKGANGVLTCSLMYRGKMEMLNQ